MYRDAEPQGKDASLGHTDCFMISRIKILEGVGEYVVVAVVTKSFNGRIMMGTWIKAAFQSLSVHVV